MAKVTIIIPVYNAEKYLEECLVSALNQTLADIEVVIINDCSPDGSELIIIEFLQKDSRIKYMRHECNQGQAMARNTGLKVANGEYICFLDADDKLEVNGLEHLYDLASRDDLDILEGNYIAFDSSGNLKAFAEFSRAGEVFKGREVFEIAYNERFFFTMPVWKRLWKREFLLKTDFEFPKMYHEELIPLINSYLLSDRVMYTNQVFYKYRLDNSSSITNSASLDQVKDFYIVSEFLEGLIQDHEFSTSERNFFKRRLANTMKTLFRRSSTISNQDLVEFDALLKSKKRYFLHLNNARKLTAWMFYLGCFNPKLSRAFCNFVFRRSAF